MLPMLLLAFGTTAASQMMKGQEQKRALELQQRQMEFQNEMTAGTNTRNAQEALRTIAGVRMQESQMRQQAARDLSTAERMANMARGEQTAMAAAVGVKGASVDAVASDIEVELDRARREIQDTGVTNAFNANERVRSIAVQTNLNVGRLLDPSSVNVPSTSRIIGQAALAGAMSAGSTYAQNYFKFGGSNGATT